MLRADAEVPAGSPASPRFSVRPDSASTYWQVQAAFPGTAPVSVAFAVHRAGSTGWQRLDVDDNPPYRAFLDPGRFRKDERISLVAVVRSLDGRITTSAVLPFRVGAR